MEPEFYEDYGGDFNKTLSKFEFSKYGDGEKRVYAYQEPYQLMLKNYISQSTMYENVLLYHGVGVGKTLSSISIAEGFKEYVHNMGRRIVVLTKNKNIQRNFMNELLSKGTGDSYITDEQRELYFASASSRNPAIQQQKKDLVNRVYKEINKTYQFITYGTFVNQILGAKEYIKDEYGRNTNKPKMTNGVAQRKRAKNEIRNLNNTVIIVDEAHNITNNDVYIALQQVLGRSYNYRLVLLTATPMYDNPKEIFELSNLLNMKDEALQLPIRGDLLKPTGASQPLVVREQSAYINNSVLKGGIIHITSEGLGMLRKALLGKVSYIRPNTQTNPQKNDMGQELIPNRKGTVKVVYCPMSKLQYVTYLKALSADVKTDSKWDIATAIQNLESAENTNEDEISMSKTSSLYKQSSDASTMIYPGGQWGKDGFMSLFKKSENGYVPLDKTVLTTDISQFSSKLYLLLQNIAKSPGNAFIYSNYVNYGGTALIKQLLLANGYKEYRGKSSGSASSFVVFDNTTSVETRERWRMLFNSSDNADGKYIKIVIGSPIMSEGITLKNVRQVHIVEPSWNMSRINQIIGRAVRNYSHADLPEEERTVDIYKYVSVFDTSKSSELIKDSAYANFFIDREKYVLSEEKDRSNKQVERMLKEVAFDCNLMKKRNEQTGLDGEAECDYRECAVTCDTNVITDGIPSDKSTYNLHINNFDKYEIYFVMNTLRDMFRKYFVWSLDDIVSYTRELEKNVSLESIYATLGHITQNKVLFTDMYNRDGYVIARGPYYIFNSSDIDVSTSLYGKVLDFTVEKNKYTLREHAKTQYNVDVFGEKEPKQSAVEMDTVHLSTSDRLYNKNIIENEPIFGTYRQRSSGNNEYGPRDKKFRIVDMRNIDEKSFDKRKNVSGMWVGSFKKPKLTEIAKFLSIEIPQSQDKEQLGQLIERYLLKNGKVLK
jgi:superfamily II DNA or RNA helicase